MKLFFLPFASIFHLGLEVQYIHGYPPDALCGPEGGLPSETLITIGLGWLRFSIVIEGAIPPAQ
jgi:hypothetical protein